MHEENLNEVTVTTTGILPGVGPAGWPPVEPHRAPATHGSEFRPSLLPTTNQEMSFRSIVLPGVFSRRSFSLFSGGLLWVVLVAVLLFQTIR